MAMPNKKKLGHPDTRLYLTIPYPKKATQGIMDRGRFSYKFCSFASTDTSAKVGARCPPQADAPTIYYLNKISDFIEASTDSFTNTS
jgi:hypothetical protein